MVETIKIKYFSDDIKELCKVGGEKSDWIDLRAAEDIELMQGQFSLVPLGVAMELPQGYEAHVVPRSSTFKNWGVIQTNSIGIIDQLYCGDNDQWFIPFYCLEWKKNIKKGDRVCQFRIMKKQPTINFVTVDTLENENRGGFGSSGIN